jgi:hypothetical protein
MRAGCIMAGVVLLLVAVEEIVVEVDDCGEAIIGSEHISFQFCFYFVY